MPQTVRTGGQLGIPECRTSAEPRWSRREKVRGEPRHANQRNYDRNRRRRGQVHEGDRGDKALERDLEVVAASDPLL